MKKSLLLLTILLLSLPTNAYDAKVNGIFYNLDKTAMTAEVTWGNEYYYRSLTIPETISYEGNEYSVTSIGDKACNGSYELYSVTIGNKVKTIGEEAFHGCAISTLTIGNSVTTIGKLAFYNCERLNEVTIPNSVTTICDNAFGYCDRLTSVTIGNGVTNIGKHIFIYCMRLSEIIVDSDNKKYDSRNNCNAIIETTSNKLICGGAETEIPNSVTSIGDYAFYGCWDLTSISVPNSVTSIGNCAFAECINFDSISLGNNVKTIGNEAFRRCNLTSINLPEGLISIGDHAFGGKITSITIPNSVTNIGKGAFSSCPLVSINIPEKITCINDSVFYLCRSLTSITIPNSVTSIGDGAFGNCESLTSITIPNNVTSIGDGAFSYCGLTSISIPDNVKTIGSFVFAGCSKLTELAIGKGVTSIGSYAFSECPVLTSLTIPKSVTSIGDVPFEGCIGLISIIVENGNPKYDSRDNCNAIIETASNTLIGGCQNTVIPGSVKIIGHNAFAHCQCPSNFTIPEGVTVIGTAAFDYCNNLTTITLPVSITSIGECAFRSCTALTSITIPERVTEIGELAFYDCTGLTSVTSLSPNPVNCYANVFSEVYGLGIPLYVPYPYISVYKNTYPWAYFHKIVGLTDRTLKLTCMAGDKDVTSEVSIAWQDAEGNDLGNGQYVGCNTGQHLYYSISLNEDMGHAYHEVENQLITVGEDSVLICQLQTIERVQIRGRISAEDIDKKTATIHVKQLLNGKYEESYSTTSNQYGEFSLDIFDDQTEILVTCDGYMDAELHRSSFNNNGNLGVITLSPITGFVIKTELGLMSAFSDKELIDELLPGGLYDLELHIMNESTGSEITDYSIQYNGSIVIFSGASARNQIKVTAKCKRKVLADTECDVYLDEDEPNYAYFSFIELGSISASIAGSKNSSNAAYLYDSNGQLVKRQNYSGETMVMKYIPEGTYTFVSVGQSSSLSNIYELSQLSQLHLSEGKDYLSTQVEVRDGETTEISVGNIPKLNESLFLFDGSLYADKSSVVNGWYVTLSARINIEKALYEKVNKLYLSIDIPEGCQFVDNSVLVNRVAQSYTLDGNTLSIHLDKDQAQGEVRFSVIPSEISNYNLTGYVAFDKEITTPRPFGVAHFKSEAFSINLPEMTAQKRITVWGINIPDSELKIYDGDVKIGETTSKSDGFWSAVCELYTPLNLSCHDITAKAKTKDGRMLTSDMRTVLYDESCITLKKVSMTFYNGWHKNNITVDFNIADGTTSAKHYDFYNETDFTFIATFTQNDPEMIGNVNFLVKASDGTIRTLPALFDSKQQAWVATSRYDSYKLPQNVTVDYDNLREELDEERKESIVDMAALLSDCANLFYNNIEEKGMMELVEEDETSATLDYILSYHSYRYQVSAVPYSEAETMMKNYQFIYYETESGGMGTYTEVEENVITVTLVDLGEREAYRIKLSDPYSYSKKRAKKNAALKNFISDLGSGLLDGVTDILGISEYTTANKDFKFMEKKLRSYEKKYNAKHESTFNNILAKCPDGSDRLTKNERGKFSNEMQTKIWPLENEVIEKCNFYLEDYKKKLTYSVATFACTLSLNKYLKSAKFANSKLNKAFKNMLVKNTTLDKSAETLGGMLGLAWDKSIAAADKIFSYQDFKKVKDESLLWSSKKNAAILRKYADLNKRISEAYSSCKKEKDPEIIHTTDGKQETFVENQDNNTVNFTTPPVEPILDPSGFVYEAVLSNRLPGVTTTVYQKKNGSAMKWNAEDYSQENPLVTDEAGFYRWDVPQGEWQVKYEKEGYETCYSEWLPVPPPQLDINVGMKQTTPPVVTKMQGAESGITIEMSKYMQQGSMVGNNIIVKKDGSTLSGSIEMLNIEQSPTDDMTYVSKVKFLPEMPFTAGEEVYVTVKGNVESYCGVQMGTDHTEKVIIDSEVTAIIIDSVLTIPYEGHRDVQVLVMPQEVSAGKVLNARLSSSLIASLANEKVTIDENGLATLTVNGDLPGGALLTVTMDNTDLSVQSKVRVDVDYEVVSTPTASIRNGDQVDNGTKLSLSCATDGATIYYTLDGSCPCDEAKRIRYTGPFVLPVGVVTVKAIAVYDYLYDSDVVTFVYQVNAQTGINELTKETNDFRVSYSNGIVMIEGAEGANCKIYDMAGRELTSKALLNEHEILSVPKADIYVVHLKFNDGRSAVKKIRRM